MLSQLKTTTTAAISKDFTKDRIWLNGREEDVGQPRIQACLRESEWGAQGRPSHSLRPRLALDGVGVHRARGCPSAPHPGTLDPCQLGWG